MTALVPPPRVPLLKTGETARALGVSGRTVNHWTASGKLAAISTPGAHHRYQREEVAQLAEELGHAWPSVERDEATALGVEDYRREVR